MIDNGEKHSINFSHTYQKILDRHNDVIESAKLLQVIPVKLEELSDVFKNYDTDNGMYKLPRSGEYLMLIFLKNPKSYMTDLNLFTTLRRSTPEKLKYYTSCIGEVFEIGLSLSAIADYLRKRAEAR